MNLLPQILFILWIPFAMFVFMALRGHRAVAWLVIAGWLFLPAASFDVPGLPDLTKITAVNVGTLFVALLLDSHRFRLQRLHWVDMVVVALILCPLPTAMTNGLGIYDGLSAALERSFKWGIPFLLGRIYFDDHQKLTDLAKVVFVGGLAYVPFCLFEMRMSPSLNEWIYGFRPRPFNGWRLGGWRPNVFLEEGLELGMLMTAATLSGFAVYLSNRRLRLGSLPIWSWLILLAVTTILCRSSGALVLLMVGVTSLLFYGKRLEIVVLGLLCLGPCLYLGLRSTNTWNGSTAVKLANDLAGRQRAHSLGYRFHCENVLLAKALQRPVFGWGGYGRSRVKDANGEDIVDTDGLWIISLGTSGLVGLAALYGTLLLPSITALRRFAKDTSSRQATGVVAYAMAVLLTLYAVDGLLNWFYSPIYLLIAGSLSSWALGYLPGDQPASDASASLTENPLCSQDKLDSRPARAPNIIGVPT